MPADAPERRREGAVYDLMVQRDPRARDERRIGLARENHVSARAPRQSARERVRLAVVQWNRGADDRARDPPGLFGEFVELVGDADQMIQPAAPQEEHEEPVRRAVHARLPALLQKLLLLGAGDVRRLEEYPDPRGTAGNGRGRAPRIL